MIFTSITSCQHCNIILIYMVSPVKPINNELTQLEVHRLPIQAVAV